MHFKGSCSGYDKVIWRLAQGWDDAWKRKISIYEHTLPVSILAHKECGETTDLTPPKPEEIAQWGAEALDSDVYKGQSGSPQVPGIYARDNKGEVSGGWW